MSSLKLISSSLIVLLFLGLSSQKGNAKDPSELAFGFCYALQASMICNDLNMRVDTEKKIEKQVGAKLRGPQSPYNKDCMAGLDKAFEDENKGLCKVAWEKYGCEGSEVPRLIFKKRGAYCIY